MYTVDQYYLGSLARHAFNPGKDSKYDVTSDSLELGFAPLYQPFVDS